MAGKALPSAQPAVSIRVAQPTPPMTLKVTKVRYRILTPATMGAKVLDDGDEAGQDDRLGAVPLEEVLGLLEMLLLEEAGIRPVEQGRADPLAEAVAHLLAAMAAIEQPTMRIGSGGRTEPESSPAVNRSESPQEEPDHEPGLGEDDGEHHQCGQAPEVPLRSRSSVWKTSARRAASIGQA